jgi:hypothetical protein
MSFDDARAVADAVLFEGYALYPYRPSSPKNQLRWQFGVLAPRGFSEGGGGDPWWQETQILVELAADPAVAGAGGPPRVDGQLRFLQLARRAAEPGVPGGALPWDEGDKQEIALRFALTGAGADGEQVTPFLVPGGAEERGGVVRRRWPVGGVVRVTAEPVAAARPLVKLRVRVENVTAWALPGAPRDEALPASLLGTHLLLGVSGGAFVSLLDPPDWAAAAAEGCRNVRTYPVLAGPPGRRDLVLSAPVILYDHPAVAPESPRDLYDATEIDEILTLRILTLTDEEKREARAADPRLAALLDGVERLSPEDMARLHGATRELRPVTMPAPAPAEEPPAPREVRVGATMVGPGSRVRLRPGARRADAQDLFLAGMIATVEAVMRDVEGAECLAVTVDDDPAAELQRWRRSFRYFRLDEVEPVEPTASPTPAPAVPP